jgi:transcription elongation factor Elf1
VEKIKIRHIETVVKAAYKCKVCGIESYNFYDKIDLENGFVEHLNCTNCGQSEKFDKKTKKEIENKINNL